MRELCCRFIAPSSMKHLQQGFTLAELMIVVLVLAILATIAYPSYDTYVRNARMENARTDLLANAQALERFYAQNHRFPTGAAGDTFQLKENPYFDITLAVQPASAAAVGYTLQAVPNSNNANENSSLRLNENGVMTICDNDGNCTLK